MFAGGDLAVLLARLGVRETDAYRKADEGICLTTGKGGPTMNETGVARVGMHPTLALDHVACNDPQLSHRSLRGE